MTRAAALSHIPAGMSFEAAATTPSTFFTAYYALHHLAGLQPGEKIVTSGLHNAWLLSGLFALMALVVSSLMPARLNPRSPSAAN